MFLPVRRQQKPAGDKCFKEISKRHLRAPAWEEMSGDRFPVEVKALGLLKHRKQKAYMLSVSWSDHTNILIYRTFEDFKKLHKELKRKFPIESGLLNKSERTIPKFQAAHLRLRTDRNPSRSLVRLKLFEVYCTELLKAKTKISQGEDVTRFFEARSQDLDPSFPQNSIIILPSEMKERKEETTNKASIPSITQPVISQSYSCIEAFETKDTKNRPFQTTKGETLEVLMKDSTGWWLVENDQKQIAWFPAPYLEEKEEASVVRETDDEEMLYYITRSYKARNQDELSVNIGVVVEVLEKSDNGWWLVWYNGSAGYIPSMFLRPYKNPHSKFLALAHSGLCISTPNLSVTPPFGRNVPKQQKGSHLDASQPHSASNTEGEDSPLSRIRSRSLSGAAGAAGSTKAFDQDSLSESSGSVSKSGLYWARKIEAQSLGNIPQPVSGTQGSPSSLLDSKQRSDSGFGEEPFACADNSPCSSPDSEGAPSGPTVPPRPSVHEILQKCSTVTKRAVQGTRPRPSLHTSSWNHD